MKKTRESLKIAKRVVVKVGTSTLTYDNGNMNFSRIDKLARVLSDLVNQGKEVVLSNFGGDRRRNRDVETCRKSENDSRTPSGRRSRSVRIDAYLLKIIFRVRSYRCADLVDA